MKKNIYEQALLLSVICAILIACKGGAAQQTTSIPKTERQSQTSKAKEMPNKVLYQLWFYSYEESTPENKVFRPATYNFPRSRGREGIELKENGECILHRNGADDTPQQIRGQWKMVRNNYYIATLSNAEKIILDIQYIDTEKMIVKNL